MALVSSGSISNRMNNYCIFQAVRPFDVCRTYGSPCSPDANVDDGWFICDFHASVRFKMEKMSMPIVDGEGNTYYRTVGKSLVNHKAVGNDRILIPTRENYQTVLNVMALPLPEQLVLHIIYNNYEAQEQVCQSLRYNESFQLELVNIVNDLYSITTHVLSQTDPTRFCSVVKNNSARTYSWDDESDDISERVVASMPPFLQNLINKCVAPQIMKISTESLEFRNCATCRFDSTGLVANVPFYNPVQPKYRSGINENFLQIENVLKFKGNATALQRSLARYEQYPMMVPLIMGSEILKADDGTRPTILPISVPREVIPPFPPANAPGVVAEPYIAV
ncbi:VP39 [Chrysodeixis includens nucleopolyhedrovirus]|uniref:VP39 n=1 Tax=Chrysodeixis includens nucleopolyhedrovirus TaxID=1207438 RepID=A0A1C8ZX34_9ABAC|nr:VP39 [Chrysodeixis includens nucleopolyhedrovirus]AOL56658.1 VP39 [Chrysodeixis includens nucleopolyhedrovirus]AOL56799.1 VP39 [Chrysodeixis includens nucleopolyhedrovirus]AOL56941.1 VP39 [Chrysodeixis includens nucleopolyhedrovirus]AOL57083.1 VP39 [Chrysodeixis includens nucleopolyhedrovirus]